MKTDEGVGEAQRKRSRAMRRAPTETEQSLRRLLRDRRLDGLKFRRQVPVGPYIVDLLCVGARLIVESDGSQHAESRSDAIRDAFLASESWTVLRFWNHEVLRNRDSVLNTILARAGLPWCAAAEPSSVAASHRHLPPEGEGPCGASVLTSRRPRSAGSRGCADGPSARTCRSRA